MFALIVVDFDVRAFQNTILPSGSDVVLMGLADGRILYEALATRIYPIGSFWLVSKSIDSSNVL